MWNGNADVWAHAVNRPPADADPELCYICGAWGVCIGRDEYRCPNCGDEWDVYAEQPEYREEVREESNG